MKFIIINGNTGEIVTDTKTEENLISDIEDILIDVRVEDLIIYKKWATVDPISINKIKED